MASILSIILTVAVLAYAIHAAIKFVFPSIKDILRGVVKDDKVVKGMIMLLTIFIILTGTSLILEQILSAGNEVINYIGVIKPGIDLILSLTGYIEWIIIGAAIIIAIRTYKRG